VKARFLGSFLFVGAMLFARAADEGNVAAQEARMAAAVLVRQNEALRAEVARLREEVAKLTLSLAQARAEIDETGVGRNGGGRLTESSGVEGQIDGGSSSVVADSWKITEVNPDLKLVVLDSGRASGLKQGMMLYALRGDRPAARLRVVDVREHMTGAVVEANLGFGNPEKGDRVVLMTVPK